MADPVGAPTFAQMFSPTKSPFHALNLAALVGISATVREPMSQYSVGFCFLVLVISAFMAPFYRPKFDNNGYGINLMFARSAGIIGAIISFTILVKETSLIFDPDSPKLVVDSPMFTWVLTGITIQAFYMTGLMFFKNKALKSDEAVKRYNISQFCLMQSTFLIFIVYICVGESSPEMIDLLRDSGEGLRVIATAPLQATFHDFQYDSFSVISGLCVLWFANGIVNAVILFRFVELGWIGDHGNGDNS